MDKELMGIAKVIWEIQDFFDVWALRPNYAMEQAKGLLKAYIEHRVEAEMEDLQIELTQAYDVIADYKGEVVELKAQVEAVKKAERAKLIRQIETVEHECPYGHNHICLHRDEYETMIKGG